MTPNSPAAQPSETPRSSGGAPTDPESRVLVDALALASRRFGALDLAGQRNTQAGVVARSDEVNAKAALIAQVSALRQEAAALTKQRDKLAADLDREMEDHGMTGHTLKLARQEAAGLHGALAIAAETNQKLGSTLSAARQEAETLTRQRDAAIREISVIAREAETLRKQRDEALAAHAASFHALVSISLQTDCGGEVDEYPNVVESVKRLAGEAETLRDQLGAAQKDADQTTDELGQALMDLAQAEKALVLLANQLERYSVPFVPEAEAATALARHELANDERLMAVGLRAAQRVYDLKHAARVAAPREPTNER
jgi:chromosome segregation ATPase